MKLFIIIIVTACCSLNRAYGQAAENRPAINTDSAIAMLAVLTPGIYIPQYRGQVNTMMRRLELSDKSNIVYRKNIRWFTDSSSQAAADSSLYFQKIGLSREEYRELNQLSAPHIAYSRRDTLQITNTGHDIIFHGSGDLATLNEVRIDLAQNLIFYKQYKLVCTGKTANNNGDYSPLLKSTTYYSYENQYSDDAARYTLENIAQVELSAVTMKIGIQQPDKKPFLLFTVMLIDKMKLQSFIDIYLVVD